MRKRVFLFSRYLFLHSYVRIRYILIKGKNEDCKITDLTTITIGIKLKKLNNF